MKSQTKFTMIVGIAAAFVMSATTVTAQDLTPLPVPSLAVQQEVASISPPLLTTLPPAARLTGLRPVYQLPNRCSAAALTIQLSYYGWQGTYTHAINHLNTHPEDVAVRIDEMAEYVRSQGLGAVVRIGGTVELVRQLVAEGFPVLVENSYFEDGSGFNAWLGHNRVIMGYDDAQQVFLTYDSLLGHGVNNTGRPMSYELLEDRWRAFNRNYLVIYRPEDELRLQAILGVDWDPELNALRTLLANQAEIDAGAEDGFTWFNIGSSLLGLGRYAEAVDAFARADQLGLPFRMLWYQYGPFEAWYLTGQYDVMLQRGAQVLATTPGVEEIYYYMGLAYEALGDPLRAAGQFEIAVARNHGFVAATFALARVRGETPVPRPTPTPVGSPVL